MSGNDLGLQWLLLSRGEDRDASDAPSGSCTTGGVQRRWHRIFVSTPPTHFQETSKLEIKLPPKEARHCAGHCGAHTHHTHIKKYTHTAFKLLAFHCSTCECNDLGFQWLLLSRGEDRDASDAPSGSCTTGGVQRRWHRIFVSTPPTHFQETSKLEIKLPPKEARHCAGHCGAHTHHTHIKRYTHTAFNLLAFHCSTCEWQ